jgi:hypothetical protein
MSGANEVYIMMLPPQPCTLTFGVGGYLNPPLGTVYGHLWASNGTELAGAGANPSTVSNINGSWTLSFSLPAGTQGEFALKVVYLDPTDPASDTKEITVGSPPPPPPWGPAKANSKKGKKVKMKT